jgi:hypothetical protein
MRPLNTVSAGKPMPTDSGPDVLFLGLAERAAYVRDGNTNLFKWNVLGLKHIILSHIYPLSLSGWSFGFAFHATGTLGEHKLLLTDESGTEVGQLNVATKTASPSDPDAALRSEGPLMPVPTYGWIIAFLSPPKSSLLVMSPGTYHVRQATPEGAHILGELHFAVVDPPPLTQERIAAIRSDPTAMKSVRVEIGCKQCPAKSRAYAALDRNPASEAEGWTWYQDLPTAFACTCGKTKLPLDSIRQNLHGLLGARQRGSDDLSFLPLYERSTIETVRSTFAEVLQSAPKEEFLQKFLEENPILLHQFPSVRLFSKPPILTFFVADFALLTPNKELLLIELEKTTTKLMKKDGGLAADLSHAFDQVRNWLHVVDEHRLAVLETLKIARDEVSSIRGVVIAGRDAGYDAHHLRKLKGADWGRVLLFTYDDLLFALDALVSRINSL